MAQPFAVEFLGTGTSTGVPVIGCHCPVCRSTDPRNKRLRSSIVVRCGETVLLVDSSPDLRQQALRSGLERIDAILYTHIHLDHVAGFDDLRAFCWHRDSPLPFYTGPKTLEGLKAMYGWAFAENNNYKGYVRPLPVVFEEPVFIGCLKVTPVPVDHASIETRGYVFENTGGRKAAYIPDVKEVPPSSLPLLQGVDILIMDALMKKSHPTHSSVAETLDVIQKTGAVTGCLTHMSHDLDYKQIGGELPAHVIPAYDGLRLIVE